MKYLQLICIEGETGTPEAAQAMRDHVEPWVEETVRRGINLVGKPLDGPATARTVRVRGDETLVSDGPFADTKEFIGGLDLLECESLDEAIEVASKHPVSWFHAIELRPFPEGVEVPARITGEDLRHLLLICDDGSARAQEVDEEIIREGEAWRQRATERGALVFANGLQPPETATTVRVRDGRVLLTDGPFVETKEFLAGVALLSCDSQDEAIELAADLPLARHSVVEVRRFVDL